jgi:antitoxin component YwqK of YwqJK toxin-antitoxin module
MHEGDTINVVDKDSLKQGIWRDFWSNTDIKSEVLYKNGKKQGLEIFWYNFPNCVKEERFYTKGLLDGPITSYSRSCKKEQVENYKNGVKEGLELCYHPNGRLKSEGNFKKGNLDGVYKVYDKKGKFSFESRSSTGAVEFNAELDDTLDHTIYKVFTRNNWKKTIIVTDLTASMYPYAKEINTWLKLHFMKDTLQQTFVFFNDGDTKKDDQKRIGNTGGIYYCRAKSSDDLINTMKVCIKKGEGGDSPENVIEAILAALKKIRKPDNIILIADNWAKVRDLILLNRIKVPVRVILCGVYEGMEINTDYLNIAYKTKGSVHTIEQDISELINQTSGKRFNINGFDYIIKNGSIRAY